jgi:hypothetical protein
MTEWVWAAAGLMCGALLAWWLAPRRTGREPDAGAAPPEDPVARPAEEASPPPPPHLISLISQALREPLRELRRTGAAPRVRAQLERLGWQMRMLVAPARPMRAVPASPLALLQEAAAEVPLLRDGRVTASWSILNRQPAHVDPERMRAAFRELLASGADLAGERGRMGIKILPGPEPGYPVQIEIEIGRRGSEADALAMLVARQIVEAQGGRLETDGAITRIRLRHTAPEPATSVA